MKDNNGKILLALLAGASAGVVAGLLMAPDTGEVTRGSLKKWAGRVSKDLEKNLQDSLEEIRRMSGATFGKSGGDQAGGSNQDTGASSGRTTGTNGGATGTNSGADNA